jgi:sugar (pentulose or hexulose) kinase
MGIIAIDLGTTNIKVAGYTDHAMPISLVSHPVTYDRQDSFVEFDADQYFSIIESLIARCFLESFQKTEPDSIRIILTGQAESLVILDQNGRPLRKGISWLDMRSEKECRELSSVLDADLCYKITGQPEIIPTWPLTKILWLKNNEPDVFKKAHKYLLLKDFIIYRLTGQMVGEHSIYTFSHYFNMVEKTYWEEPLNYCGVRMDQLPKLVAPCYVVGCVTPEACIRTGLAATTTVNVGTLDHFAGMIGTGNLKAGLVSESAGTVSSLATFVRHPNYNGSKIPLYCGPFPGSYIYLPVCESGGISLEWFKNNFMPGDSYQDIDEEAKKHALRNQLTFLPYITGVNPPDFNADASGVFFGIHAGHDKYDFALAIMIGVACLLRRNIDHFESSGIEIQNIISTGGGAKSQLWSQIKADITNKAVLIPENEEAPCLGSAIISAVTNGDFTSYEEAVATCVRTKTIYTPSDDQELFERKYQLFNQIYNALKPSFSYRIS